MIFEKNQISHNITKLQTSFFDLITSKTNRSFDRFVSEVATQIKRNLGANRVGIYLYCNITDKYQLYPQSSLDRSYLEAEPFIKEEWVSFKKQNKHVIEGLYSGERLCLRKDDSDHIIVPLKVEQSDYGFILYAMGDHVNQITADLLIATAFETLKVLKKMETYYHTLEEEQKYELLFKVTSKFHSSMDMDDLLGEIISTLKQIYSDFDYHLLLSHDYSSSSNLPIKELIYDNDVTSKASAQAYLTGHIQFEDRMKERQSCLYAPLKGKQGVYGVLQVVSPKSRLFPQEDVEFIKLLANTAGNALENARLYQQSKRLISDLQLINKTSHTLNSNLRLSETISYMANQITQSFNANEVGFILFQQDPEEPLHVLTGSTPYFNNPESSSFIKFLNDAIKKQEDALFIGDFSMKYPNVKGKYQSVMAIPMVQRGQLKGLVIVLNEKSYSFSFETFKLLQSLVHHSTLAFSNSMLREELERLVITDYLTKMYSRNYLDEKLHFHMEEDTHGVFLLIDIDDFKKVNDTYGHQVGDDIIIQVANIINDQIRKEDFAARWGGEELAVYLPNVDMESGIEVAERLVKQVEISTEPAITISCGISYWNDKEHDQVKDVFIRADQALYEAKKAGKNRIMIESGTNHLSL